MLNKLFWILALNLTLCLAKSFNDKATVKTGYSKTYSEASGWSYSGNKKKKDYTSGGYGSYYEHKSTSYDNKRNRKNSHYSDYESKGITTEDLRELYYLIRRIPPTTFAVAIGLFCTIVFCLNLLHKKRM